MIVRSRTQKIPNLKKDAIEFEYRKCLEDLPHIWNVKHCQVDLLTKDQMVDFEFKRHMIENDHVFPTNHPNRIGIPKVISSVPDLNITNDGGDTPKVTSSKKKNLRKKYASTPISTPISGCLHANPISTP